MSSYFKYVTMGMTTILLPLGKWIFKKMKSRFTEKSIKDSSSTEKVLSK